MLLLVPGAGRPCPEDGRKTAAETTAESGRSRAPLPVNGREPLSLEKGLAGNVSAVAAEKAPFLDEKGRLEGKPPEERRWWEMPLTFPSRDGVGGEGIGAGGERRTDWGLSKNDNQHRVKTMLEKS
jgi:hypothetical protein